MQTFKNFMPKADGFIGVRPGSRQLTFVERIFYGIKFTILGMLSLHAHKTKFGLSALFKCRSAKWFSIFFFIMISPAFADDTYNAGYNSGYYGTTVTPPPTSQYGRGYDDGSYDASQDDQQARQRSEDFEAAMVREQERDVHH